MSTLDLTAFKQPAPLLTRQEWEEKLQGNLFKLTTARQQRILEEGFPIITRESLDELVRYIGTDTVFEVGAGTGYLARLLHDRGVIVSAVDSKEGRCTRQQWWEEGRTPYFPIDFIDATKLATLPGDIVLMSWPCYDSNYAYEIARKLLPGQVLLYQGESRGGCCATNEFFDYLNYGNRFIRENLDDLEDAHIADCDVNDNWMAWLAVR